VDWLEKEKPKSATLALVIGYVEEGNKEAEALIEEIESLRQDISKAHEEQKELKRKLAELQSRVSNAGEA
jgi:uncharacterized coiled-coil DUF342 family protein